MAVSDGSPVNATYTNSKLMSRTADTDTAGRVDLINAVAVSGASVTNVQREINSHNAYSGRPAGSAHNATPVWTNNDVGTSADTLKARAEALTESFNETTGHTHSGAAGEGGPISVFDLSNISFTTPLVWFEDAEAPFADLENSMKVYLYTNGITQNLYATMKVPHTYQTGSQLLLKTSFYSPDNSGTVLFKAQVTMIRPGTEAVTSTANQYTSTNTAVTLSAGTVDIPQSLSIDLTSASGQINSINLAAGYILKIRLYRDTDTATSDARILGYASEVIS